MELPKLVVYGAGDNGREFAYRYKHEGLNRECEFVGFVDDHSGEGFLGYPVLGNSKDLPRLREGGVENIIVFLLEKPQTRLKICIELEKMGFKFPSSKSPYNNTGVNIGKGVYIHPTATFLGIGGQDIGDFSVIGPYVTVEGGVKTGKGVILSPYVCVHKGVSIGDGSVFYSRAICFPRVKVGKNCIVAPHGIVRKYLRDNGKIKSPR
ncbi:hypothetical protein A3K73_04510 [Candidatus Pacearchaeota archaeon RBG_13_36_9]|nr:MAG: hypothetical protein A3K73_04510 [Candidatus Pacearchaeota archaeon RBG_13_36_9]